MHALLRALEDAERADIRWTVCDYAVLCFSSGCEWEQVSHHQSRPAKMSRNLHPCIHDGSLLRFRSWSQRKGPLLGSFYMSLLIILMAMLKPGHHVSLAQSQNNCSNHGEEPTQNKKLTCSAMWRDPDPPALGPHGPWARQVSETGMSPAPPGVASTTVRPRGP